MTVFFYVKVFIVVVSLAMIAFLARRATTITRDVVNRMTAIAALSETAARQIALDMLAKGKPFTCKPAALPPSLDGLPRSVQELFRKYERVELGEFWLAHSALQATSIKAGMRKIGAADESEIAVKPDDQRVYSLFADQPPDEPLEEWQTVWHRILAASGEDIPTSGG